MLVEGERHRNLRIGRGACITWRYNRTWRAWLALSVRKDMEEHRKERADRRRRQSLLLASIARWTTRARFRRANLRARVAMLEATRMRRVLQLRGGLRRWRRAWADDWTTRARVTAMRAPTRQLCLTREHRRLSASFAHWAALWHTSQRRIAGQQEAVVDEIRVLLAKGRDWADRLILSGA